MSRAINVFVPPHNNCGFVWNADDWYKIRQEHRIVGHLVGSLSNYPRQDNFHGLPMSLNYEEITLLKEKGYIRLVRCKSLLDFPNDELKKKSILDEQAFNEKQKYLFIKKKKYEIEKRIDTIIEGKQKKNQVVLDKERIISEAVKKIESSSNDMCRTFIGDPWILESELEEVDWFFPNTDYDNLRYKVFKDLWEKNYYLTCGIKFGGDFLCYLGDPIKYHASFIVICKKTNDQILVTDFIAYGRIGTSTKKTVILATAQDDFVEYQSLQWIENSED